MRMFRGRLEPCKDNLGGIKEIYLFSYDYDKAKLAIGKRGVSITSYPSTLIFKYYIKDGNFTENRSDELGDWSQDLSFTLPNQNALDSFEIQKLMKLELGVIILERSGVYRLIGAENGCNIDSSKVTSGGGHADFNGYNIAISGKERYKSPQIVDFANSGFTDNEFVFLANNFEYRVLVDNGIFESKECLIDLLIELEITDPIAILANRFNDIVIQDSGEFESKQCLFETLQEIDIL